MKLTVLGYWGAYPYQQKGTSSYLLEADGFSLLIDAGSTTLIQLERHLDPLQLNAVVLSHYHFDHIADLGVLQYYRQLHQGTIPTPVLPIYGHTEDPVHFAELNMPNVSQGIAYTADHSLEIGPFSLSFLKTIHPVPCFAMRIEERATGKLLVFTGDSGYLEDLIPFSAGCDVLLADTYLFAGHENHHAHLTAGEAGAIAKAAEASKLILTHLPQTGDLEELYRQAAAEAEQNVEVILATLDLSIEIV